MKRTLSLILLTGMIVSFTLIGIDSAFAQEDSVTMTPDAITADYWLANGSSIYYNGGKVGIGTSTPGKPLDIASAGGIRINRGDSMSSNNELFFANNGQIRSLDNNHRIIFDRTNNILELREYGEIIFSPGSSSGQRTARMVMYQSGEICMGVNCAP